MTEQLSEPLLVTAMGRTAGRSKVDDATAARVYPEMKTETTATKAEDMWRFYTDFKRTEAEIRRRAIGETRKKEGMAYTGPLGKEWGDYKEAERKLAEARAKCGYYFGEGRNWKLERQRKLYKKGEPNEVDKKQYDEAQTAMVNKKSQFERKLLPLVLGDLKGKLAFQKFSALWGQADVQKAFRENLAVHEKQKAARMEAALGNKELNYRSIRGEIGNERNYLFELFSRMFSNGKSGTSVLQHEVAITKDRINLLKERLDNIRYPQEQSRENTDVAAEAKYDDLSRYYSEITAYNFAWLPSRLEVLEQLTKNLALGTWTMLMGEAGTGKTQLARSAGRFLQGLLPRTIMGKPMASAREFVGKPDMDGQGSYQTFGDLMAGFTGCRDSREMETHLREIDKAKGEGRAAPEVEGRIVLFDEMNMCPDAAEPPLKAIAGLQPGDRFQLGDLPGTTLKMAEHGTGLVATGNPSGKRYNDRFELGPQFKRLFLAGWLELEYPEMEIGKVKDGKQRNNTELYDVLLAALMTPDKRIIRPRTELAADYEDEVVDAAAGTHTKVIRLKPEDMATYEGKGKDRIYQGSKHGALFRFALLMGAVNDSFSRKPVVLPGADKPLPVTKALQYTMLDMGTVMSWMKELREGESTKTPLQKFFWDKLNSYGRVFEESLPDDHKNFKELCAAYGFDLDVEPKRLAPLQLAEILTPKEIGYLSPEVPRPILQKGEELGPQNKAFFDEQWNQYLIDVNSVTVKWQKVDAWGIESDESREFSEGVDVEVKFAGATRSLKFLGIDPEKGEKGWVVFSEDAKTIVRPDKFPSQFPRERFEEMVKRGEITIVPGRKAR